MSETTQPGPLGQPAPEPAATPAPAVAAETTEATEGSEGQPAAPAEPAKPRAEPWEVKRIRQITARNAAMEAELAVLRASQPKPEPGAQPTPADYQADVARAAAEQVKADAFRTDCNAVASAGSKEFPDFDATIGALWAGIGGFNPGLVEAALEAGDAHKVLYKLGQDPEEAERIAGLSPARMGAALAKLAAQPAPAAPVRTQSSAPAPIRPLERGGGNPEPRPDGSQDEFTAWYEKQKKAKNRV